jgi:hypothetical protein
MSVFPDLKICGQTYDASANFLNTGSTTWTAATGIKLVSVSPLLNTTFDVSTVALSSGDFIDPEERKRFSFKIHLPVIPGTYVIQFQMASPSGVFGTPSRALTLNVVQLPDAARYVRETMPTTVHAGQQFFVQVTMRNVGTNNWVASSGYSLVQAKFLPVDWGVVAVPVVGTIAPGQEMNFTFAAKAPTTPGTYKIEWQMSHSSVNFGDITANKSIVVVP